MGTVRDVIAFPEDDAEFDAVAVTEGEPAGQVADRIDDHVHALLFHAQGRDLREATRLDHAHAALEHPVLARSVLAAPALDQHAHAALDLHGVLGEVVGDDLELTHVADLEDRGAGLERARALLDETEHDAVQR